MRVQGLSYFPNALLDLRDWIFRGTRAAVVPLPPRRLNISGEGDYVRIGEHNLLLAREIAGLQPRDQVLDLGCGIGRTASAFARFLAGEGSYDGIDIAAFAINWCRRRNLKGYAAPLRFHHADVANYVYNPHGSSLPAHFSFPFTDGSFTFVLATSLFTHLLPPAADNYLRQTARVMRPSGSFLSSWFLIDDVARHLPAVQAAFPVRFAEHYGRSLHAPEIAVAYEEGRITARFAEAGYR